MRRHHPVCPCGCFYGEVNTRPVAIELHRGLSEEHGREFSGRVFRDRSSRSLRFTSSFIITSTIAAHSSMFTSG